MSWISITVDFIPIHIITCYLEPNKGSETKQRAQEIIHAID